MQALTITQPWATLLARGYKHLENRSWKPPPELLGTQVALHASREMDVFDLYLVRRRYGLTLDVDECPLGAVVAVATLADVIESSEDPWFFGPYGWVFQQVCPIDPIPCRGARKLWRLPEPVAEQVKRGMRTSATRLMVECQENTRHFL